MQIIGHRGWPTPTTPENTLSAVAAALAAGADGVEIDVRLTADGVPVCCHDASLSRVAGVHRGVRSQTLAELGAVRVGGSHPVPTLVEVVAAVAGRGQLILDLKPEHRAARLVAAVAQAVDPLPAGEVTLSSFDAAVLSAAARLLPGTARAAILTGEESWPQVLDQAVVRGDEAVHPPARVLLAHPDRVAEAAGAGLRVRAWTVNRPVDAALLELAGVTAAITDVPDQLLARPAVSRFAHVG